MKPLRVLMALVLVLAAGQAALAVFVSHPDFANHPIPETQIPAPRADWRDWLDLGFLIAGLALATYFALVRRSRRGLFLLSLASLAWLGFWRQGCICPIGAIQNVTLAFVDSAYAVPTVVVLLFVLPLVFALFVGRVFCAAVCPLGAVQELVAVRPVKVPVWLDQALGLLAYVYLGVAVAFAAAGATESAPASAPFLICRYDPFVGLFRFSAGWVMLLVAALVLVLGIFVGRPYCRYLCPYGAILGLFSRLSKWHVRIPPQECIQCRLCEDACPYGAIREPTVTPPSTRRWQDRWRLATAILLTPVLIGMGAWLGTSMEGPLARLHPVVQFVERLRTEDATKGTTDPGTTESQNSTVPTLEVLQPQADEIHSRLRVAGAWFGAWVGLVVGGKLIHLSIRRRRAGYQPDRANCVACGRCFWYCPSEQARRGLTIQPANEHYAEV